MSSFSDILTIPGLDMSPVNLLSPTYVIPIQALSDVSGNIGFDRPTFYVDDASRAYLFTVRTNYVKFKRPASDLYPLLASSAAMAPQNASQISRAAPRYSPSSYPLFIQTGSGDLNMRNTSIGPLVRSVMAYSSQSDLGPSTWTLRVVSLAHYDAWLRKDIEDQDIVDSNPQPLLISSTLCDRTGMSFADFIYCFMNSRQDVMHNNRNVLLVDIDGTFRNRSTPGPLRYGRASFVNIVLQYWYHFLSRDDFLYYLFCCPTFLPHTADSVTNDTGGWAQVCIDAPAYDIVDHYCSVQHDYLTKPSIATAVIHDVMDTMFLIRNYIKERLVLASGHSYAFPYEYIGPWNQDLLLTISGNRSYTTPRSSSRRPMQAPRFYTPREFLNYFRSQPRKLVTEIQGELASRGGNMTDSIDVCSHTATGQMISTYDESGSATPYTLPVWFPLAPAKWQEPAGPLGSRYRNRTDITSSLSRVQDVAAPTDYMRLNLQAPQAPRF